MTMNTNPQKRPRRPIEHKLYDNIHHWLWYHYPKKKLCDFCGKFGVRTEYAKKKFASYGKSIGRYHELCVSCHRKYDFTEKTRELYRTVRLGVPAPWKWRPIDSMLLSAGKWVHHLSITRASNDTGVERTTIINNLKGRSKVCRGGFIFRYSDVEKLVGQKVKIVKEKN